jgi:hypothetical protein
VDRGRCHRDSAGGQCDVTTAVSTWTDVVQVRSQPWVPPPLQTESWRGAVASLQATASAASAVASTAAYRIRLFTCYLRMRFGDDGTGGAQRMICAFAPDGCDFAPTPLGRAARAMNRHRTDLIGQKPQSIGLNAHLLRRRRRANVRDAGSDQQAGRQSSLSVSHTVSHARFCHPV